jgi:predicted GIY-YIG superfamily endonuclease
MLPASVGSFDSVRLSAHCAQDDSVFFCRLSALRMKACFRLRPTGVLRGFDDVRNAIDREKQFKGWRRSKKIALIESRNPRWQDLTEKWGWKMASPGESIKGR